MYSRLSALEPSRPRKYVLLSTLESGIDVGQGINEGPGKFVKNNKHRALNKCRAWTKCAKLCCKKPIKLENICRPSKKFQILINVGPRKTSKINKRTYHTGLICSRSFQNHAFKGCLSLETMKLWLLVLTKKLFLMTLIIKLTLGNIFIKMKNPPGGATVTK